MKRILMFVGLMMTWCVLADNLQPFSENKTILEILTKHKGKEAALEITKKADSGNGWDIHSLATNLYLCHAKDLSRQVDMLASDKGCVIATIELAKYYMIEKDYENALKWCKVWLTQSPDNEVAQEWIKECEKTIGKKKVALINSEAALTKEQVDNLKKTAAEHKDETLVFKGLYLGMKTDDAYRMLQFYSGKISNTFVASDNGCVCEYVLPRSVIDMMFKTKDVSGEAFCKSMLSAYPIIGKFETKLEKVADVDRQKEYMEEVKENARADAIAMSGMSGGGYGSAEAYNQGVAIGYRAQNEARRIKKSVPCYYCESSKGFLLEIRPEEPDRFFTLKRISSVSKENFD